MGGHWMQHLPRVSSVLTCGRQNANRRLGGQSLPITKGLTCKTKINLWNSLPWAVVMVPGIGGFERGLDQDE